MSTIGALRQKALSAAKRKIKKANLPKPIIKKAKTKPSLTWSAARYKKGQEKK
jgi:hypothetical protein